MKFIKRGALLCASLALLAAPNPQPTAQSQIGIIEVPVYHDEVQEDFDRFTVWERGGNGGNAEPVYDGVGGSRALLIRADNGSENIEVYRRLNPYEKWQASFDVKDLTEIKGGAWSVGINETPERSRPRGFKRAYFASAGGFDATFGVYSEGDDDIKPVPNNVRKGRGFHSYSIKCDGSKLYFSIDGNDEGYISGSFRSGVILAQSMTGARIVLDNVKFSHQ